ncbi:MAG TPA: hypothetical protein PK593_04740 [Thermomicrobiales bacterium]|nr:hypothetical protein [Thermomicrobiales bacterium]
MMAQDRRALILVTAMAAIFFAAFVPRFVARLDPLTGDEPFYVMTAISIVRDRDLDESNNYAQRDFDEFYPADPLPSDWQGWGGFPRTLPPHPAQSVLPGLHTKHGLGLSFLIAVPYAFAGRIGAMAVIIIAAALLTGQMYLLAREAGSGIRMAGAIALALAVSLPIAPYALLIFPEIPAALILVYAVRRLSRDENRVWQWLLTGVAVGFLPWLHQRFAPTAAVLGIVLFWRWWRSRKLAAGIACLLVGIGAATLIYYNWWLYHSPVQNVADHAGFSSATGTVNGLFGLLLDAQWGLIINAPIYIVAIAGLPRWLKIDRNRGLLAIAAITPYLLEVGAYRVWWGEWGPAARYLVPVAPLAAATLGAVLATSGWSVRAIVGGTWLIGALLTLVGFADPQRFYHQPDGANNLVTRVGEIVGLDVAGHLVSFQPYAISPVLDRVMAGLILLLAFWITTAIIYIPPKIGQPSDPAHDAATLES